jgi:hypothetical protein
MPHATVQEHHILLISCLNRSEVVFSCIYYLSLVQESQQMFCCASCTAKPYNCEGLEQCAQLVLSLRTTYKKSPFEREVETLSR